MRPLAVVLPNSLAILVTFMVSGALHDVAVSLIKWQLIFVCTPWFTLMGITVLLTSKVSYLSYNFPIRACINFGFIALCYFISAQLQRI